MKLGQKIDRELGLSEMLGLLPKLDSIPNGINFEQALNLGANECGEKGPHGGELYKLLTRDGVMLAFEKKGNNFTKVEQMKLHR